MLEIKNFSKSKITLPLGNPLVLQKESWDRFWNETLKELFEEISPIRDYTGKEYELYLLDYNLGEPSYKSHEEAKENNDSLTAPLKVKVKLVNLKTKETKIQEIFFADFPLMSERGTFVVNGVERVIVSQLIRSSGIFFSMELLRGRKCFGAKIIPTRGSWLEFKTDHSGVIGVVIDRKRKVPATMLLRALGGFSDNDFKELFSKDDIGEIKYLEETLKKDPTKNQSEALIEIYQRLKTQEMVTAEAAREFIFNMFFNFDRYDLSKVGRWKIWMRLEELKPKKEKEITKKDRVLTPEDLIATFREIIRLNNNPKAQSDQIDHLANRRVRTMSELLANKLRLGLVRMARIIKDRMSITQDEVSPNVLINPRPFSAQIQQFFSSSQFAQFMDNENPLSEFEHKRRLAATGPGGLTRERAGFEVRDVQSSHYGKICPIETPEGQNVGLVTHLALYARINPYGFLETPYFKVEKGKVLTDKVFWLNAAAEEKYNIASADVQLDKNNRIIEKRIEARVKGEPKEIATELVDFIDVSCEQFLSVASGLIPFLENDDANRAQMGSNMQKQAVPLIYPEAPLVGTGLEKVVAQNSGQVIYAKDNGKVLKADGSKIVVKYTKDKKTITYNLKIFERTNQYTCLHQIPKVKENQLVKKGDILAEGGSINQGRLSLGKNILVAFLPWRGYTFEDAIIISERLVKEDVFSSVYIEDFFCDVRETKLGAEITTPDIPGVSEERLKDLDEEGIVRIGAMVGPNDILVGKISPKGEADLSAEERLLRAIFGEKAREVKDTSLRMEHGKRGRVIGIKIFSPELGHNLEPGIIKRIRVRIAQLRKIQVGDKLSGRHGNKGVVSKIAPIEEMPFLEDGTPVDIILNPLSVISRMNIGQILETHLGMACKKLGYLAETPSLFGAKEEDIKEELKKAGFSPDGKMVLINPKTGEPFKEKITVGYAYIMKLIHMVEDKIHARSVGPYSLITQQPLGGKAQFGGQRFGEMEVWALEGYGAAYTLQEMLTIKSDDVSGRAAVYEAILKGEKIKNPNIPASFSLLVSELKSLSLNIEIREKASDS